MATTTSTSDLGATLRETRERAGLTRAQLAGLVGCSFAQLSNIEQGAVPKRSRVLEAAMATLSNLETSESAPQGAPAKADASGPRNEG